MELNHLGLYRELNELGVDAVTPYRICRFDPTLFVQPHCDFIAGQYSSGPNLSTVKLVEYSGVELGFSTAGDQRHATFCFEMADRCRPRVCKSV